MNTLDNDEEMKTMLKNSMLEVSSPEFNSIIMKKVMFEDRRKFIIKNVSLYFLIFVTICAVIILIMGSVFPGPSGWYQHAPGL